MLVNLFEEKCDVKLSFERYALTYICTNRSCLDVTRQYVRFRYLGHSRRYVQRAHSCIHLRQGYRRAPAAAPYIKDTRSSVNKLLNCTLFVVSQSCPGVFVPELYFFVRRVFLDHIPPLSRL